MEIKNQEMLTIEECLTNEEIENLTNEEMISKLQVRLLKAKSPASMKQLSEAIDALRRSEYEEQIALTKLEFDREFHEDEIAESRKTRRAGIITGIVSAAIGGACALAVPAIRGKQERKYQDEGYAHEKTSDVLWNGRKHRSNK